MQDLVIEPKEACNPKIRFTAASGDLSISGNSYMDNTRKFYDQLIQWLGNYLKEKPNGDLSLSINLEYLNSSSYKYLMELLLLLKAHQERGNTAKAIWYHDSEDEDMVIEIEDMSQAADFEVEIVAVELEC